MSILTFKKRNWIVCKWSILLFNAVFFTLLAWLLPVLFEENDDTLMCMIANGGFSGQPDGHLVFINAIYGWAIAGLYMLTDAVEWYTVAFCAFHVLAMTAIVRLLVTDGMEFAHKALFMVFMYVLWVYTILSFQFTTTAGLLCFAGCLALLRPSAKWRVAGVLAILVAGMIRFELAGLVCILFAPFFLSRIFAQRSLVVWLFAVGALSLAGRYADGLFYRDPDWAYYRTYNLVRGKIHDNPNAGLVEKLDGVNEDDIRIFLDFEGDPQIMDLSVLERFKAKIDGETTPLRKLANAVKLKLYGSVFFLLLVGVLVSVWVSAGWLRKSARIRMDCAVLVASLFLFAALAVYLGSTATLKSRVFVCMLMAMSYLTVRLFPDTQRGRVLLRVRMAKSYLSVRLFPYTRASLGRVLLCLVLLGLICKYVAKDDQEWRSNKWCMDDFAANQKPLLEHFDGYLYPLGFNMDCYSPFGIKDIPFRMAGLGWLERIPFSKGVWEKHLDFVDSGVLYFGKAHEPPDHIMDRITHNYGVAVEAVPVKANRDYALYKIVSK